MAAFITSTRAINAGIILVIQAHTKFAAPLLQLKNVLILGNAKNYLWAEEGSMTILQTKLLPGGCIFSAQSSTLGDWLRNKNQIESHP